MRRVSAVGRLVAPTLCTLLVLVSISGAGAASQLRLVLGGYGPGIYAAWERHIGLPDASGNQRYGLELAKNVPTATNSGPEADVTGLEGQPVTALSLLSWERPTSGYCTAGASRWNIFIQGASGANYIVFLGCAYAAHSNGSARGWTRDSFSGSAIQSAIQSQAGSDALAGVIGRPGGAPALQIVFDEGPASVVLDNITVNQTTWTSPADNP